MDETWRAWSKDSYSVFHAQEPEEIVNLLKHLQRETLSASALTAIWFRLPNGSVQVQILLESAAPASASRRDSHRCIPAKSLLTFIREAMHCFNDLPALDRCELGQYLDLTPYSAGPPASFQRGRALQRAMLHAIARIDERPTRRSVTFGRVFDCVHVHGMSQERAAEQLHVEDRTLRRALHELASALAEFWTKSAAVEVSA